MHVGIGLTLAGTESGGREHSVLFRKQPLRQIRLLTVLRPKDGRRRESEGPEMHDLSRRNAPVGIGAAFTAVPRPAVAIIARS